MRCIARQKEKRLLPFSDDSLLTYSLKNDNYPLIFAVDFNILWNDFAQ